MRIAGSRVLVTGAGHGLGFTIASAFGRAGGWLTPEAVADAVVRAVEKNREFVMMPWRARAMYWLCAGWPRSWYRAVCRGLGVSRSMAGWQGHRPPGHGAKSDG